MQVTVTGSWTQHPAAPSVHTMNIAGLSAVVQFKGDYTSWEVETAEGRCVAHGTVDEVTDGLTRAEEAIKRYFED